MEDSSSETEPANDAIVFSLYVRSPVAGDRTVAIDRLSALRVDGAIDDYDIETVGEERLLAAETAPGSEEDGDPLVTLAEWEHGELRSDLELQEAATRTGRSVRKVELPELLLVIHEGDTVRCVFPCTDGSRTWTAWEFLDTYADGEGSDATLEASLPA